ncbi:hypothetical protein ACNRBS_22540 [Ralstonia pseudosolanacearum]
MADIFTKDIDQITIERRGGRAQLSKLQVLRMMRDNYHRIIPKAYRAAFKGAVHHHIARAEAQRLIQGGSHAER